MAKYTELFAEYRAKGNALPSAFEQITGFGDKFDAYYCDKEIGFENEYLFSIKLALYANILISEYKDRIAIITNAIKEAKDPTKKSYTKIEFAKGKVTNTIGKQESTNTDLPINSATATPSSKTNIGERIDTSESDDDITETNNEQEGMTSAEAIETIKVFTGKLNDIITELLKRFEPCFMGIY